MQGTVALRARGRLAMLVTRLLQELRQDPRWHAPDRRILRTWHLLVLALLVMHTTRLTQLAQPLRRARRATSTHSIASSLGVFLQRARFFPGSLTWRVLQAIVAQFDPSQFLRYQGKVLLVIDPTEYAKRSRGQGKRGRQMEHVGRVRARKSRKQRRGTQRRGAGAATPGGTPAAAVPTTTGYVDVWAGLALVGKQFLPVARHLFSSAHPRLLSQNRVEEAVLHQALAIVQRLSLAAIVVGDRGLGRKELLIRLARAGQDFVIRIDADILVQVGDREQLLADQLAQQPWLGEVAWDRGEEGILRCRARVVRGTIRFSRSGRKGDVQEATLQFLELVPGEPWDETLVLASTLPATTLAQAAGIARCYAARWAIESGFETMKAWGLERFMVRRWRAIDRLLWVVAVAFALLVLATRHRSLRGFRRQAMRVLKTEAAFRGKLTVGKLAEAIGLDHLHLNHRRAWLQCWRC